MPYCFSTSIAFFSIDSVVEIMGQSGVALKTLRVGKMIKLEKKTLSLKKGTLLVGLERLM